jgi:hypothetical protein
MDVTIHTDIVTQHDLFGLFPSAPGGRALRDTYGRDYLHTIASTGGRTTLERYGMEYRRQLAERHVPYRPPCSRRRRPHIIRFFLSKEA